MFPRLIVLAPVALFVLAPAAARADGPDVFVHIRSPEVVGLEHRATPNGAWERACDSPCDSELPHDGEYRIALTPTSAGQPFALQSARGAEELEVEMPSNGKKVAGQIVMGTGVLLAVGGLFGAVGLGVAAAHTPDCTNTDNYTCGWGQSIAGGLAIISGVVALMGGALILGGWSLSSSGDGQTTQQLDPKLDAFVRHPTWVGASATSRPPTVVPWSFSF